jgi:hypothetical protein
MLARYQFTLLQLCNSSLQPRIHSKHTNRNSNDVSEAVKHFNLARRDGAWGALSLAHMIEIYINPEGENLWDSSVSGTSTSATTTSTEGMEVAEALLQELKDIVGDNQVQVCSVYACCILYDLL